MKNTIRLAVALGFACAAVGPANATSAPQETPDIVINDGEVTLPTTAPPPPAVEGIFDKIYSGWLFRDEQTRVMQMDDFENPGMVYADQGIDLWSKVDGSEGKSCAGCHNGIDSMKGVRAVMPKVNPDNGELWSLENYVNNCRTTRMGAEAWEWSSPPMKAMTLAISLQSRGDKMNPAIDGPAKAFWEKGKEIYYTRYGQLQLSCSNCHEDNYGQMIRSDHLSQGQVNGFPVFRNNGAGVVSIHERFYGCIRDTRGEPFKQGSPEFRALELYVASRGAGLPVEGVSVRH